MYYLSPNIIYAIYSYMGIRQKRTITWLNDKEQRHRGQKLPAYIEFDIKGKVGGLTDFFTELMIYLQILYITMMDLLKYRVGENLGNIIEIMHQHI